MGLVKEKNCRHPNFLSCGQGSVATWDTLPQCQFLVRSQRQGSGVSPRRGGAMQVRVGR